MKLIYYPSRATGATNWKIPAIKALRAYANLGLKDTVDTVNAAIKHGVADFPEFIHPVVGLDVLRDQLAQQSLGVFEVDTKGSVRRCYRLALEEAIELAVELKEYKQAKSLINIHEKVVALPS